MKFNRNKITAISFAIIFVLNFWAIKLPFDILFFKKMSVVYFFLYGLWALLIFTFYQKRVSINTLSIPFAIYVFFFIIQSTVFSLSPAVSIPYVVLMLIWFVTFTVFMFFGSKFDVDYTLKLIYQISLVILIMSILILLPQVINSNKSYSRLQLYKFTEDVSSINGSSLQCVYLFLIGFYLRKKEKINKKLFIIGTVATLAFIVFSGSRTSLGILIIMFVLNFINNSFSKTSIFKYESKYLVYFLMLLPFVFLFVDLEPLFSKFNRVNERSVKHLEIINRTGFYKFIRADFIDKNLINQIFGSGLETYRFVDIKHVDMIKSEFKLHTIHSELLQIIYGGGVLGLFFYLLYNSFIGFKLIFIKDKLLRLLLINIYLLNIIYLLVQPGPINRIFLFFLPVLIVNYQKK